MQELQHFFPRAGSRYDDYYKGQPPEIAALQPVRGPDEFDLSFPVRNSWRACLADPRAENFERWVRQADEVSDREGERVAERWSQARPNDIPPLLRLMRAAESRNALRKAFTLMERAERIDGLNPEVRRARLRLLVAMAIRHLREKKPVLAAKELLQIEALPQAAQGDRPAFVAALRRIFCQLQGAPKEAEAIHLELVRLLGDPVTVQILLLQVEHQCRVPGAAVDKSMRPGTPFYAAFGRVCAMCDDMGVPVAMVDQMAALLVKELTAPPVDSDPRALLALAEAALLHDYFPVVYLAAGAGLRQGPANQGRFLFASAFATALGERPAISLPGRRFRVGPAHARFRIGQTDRELAGRGGELAGHRRRSPFRIGSRRNSSHRK